jgi:hypothetical protein
VSDDRNLPQAASILRVHINGEAKPIFFGIANNGKLFLKTGPIIYIQRQRLDPKGSMFAILQAIVMHPHASEFYGFLTTSYSSRKNPLFGMHVQQQIQIALTPHGLQFYSLQVEEVANHPELPKASLLKFHSNDGDIMYVGVTQKNVLFFKDPNFGVFFYSIAVRMSKHPKISAFYEMIREKYDFGDTIIDSIQVMAAGDQKPSLYSLEVVPAHGLVPIAGALIKANYFNHACWLYFGISTRGNLFIYDPAFKTSGSLRVI